jgi:hypothetical protein
MQAASFQGFPKKRGEPSIGKSTLQAQFFTKYTAHGTDGVERRARVPPIQRNGGQPRLGTGIGVTTRSSNSVRAA